MARLDAQIQALINYANETTGKADTQLGDAVKSLADGYKGGGTEYPLPTITDADALSSKLTALIAYANGITGKGDATIGDAVKSLVEGYGGGNPWERYNQDGLVFQLDCDTQCSAEKWTDIIGGKEFVSTGNVTLDGSGVPTLSTNGYLTYPNDDIDWNPDYTTIEFIIRKTDNPTGNANYEWLFFCNHGNFNTSAYGLLLYKNQIYKNKQRNHIGAKYSLPIGSLTRISWSGADGLIINDSKKLLDAPADYWDNYGHGTVIGSLNGTFGYLNAKIYAIRIYDRLLTEEEMLANQQIDIERFSNR